MFEHAELGKGFFFVVDFTLHTIVETKAGRIEGRGLGQYEKHKGIINEGIAHAKWDAGKRDTGANETTRATK